MRIDFFTSDFAGLSFSSEEFYFGLSWKGMIAIAAVVIALRIIRRVRKASLV